MMGEDIMTKETEDRMRLLKRHNDKRDRRQNAFIEKT